ncbi:hypothetical protein KDD30_08250 [Photobacterium sp. GJ3]|uniref:hypothetical protein n=1 Tax=Photobacterium sp. GJ3 TaxID=2829502 RepID=UPI001B8D8EB9|nr:hypothetical protein [Photobacterium sp. GJ3]QUJ66192.1 hypothetical protein KDD30_08250 [Photobacterium sp. GJ3]
MKKFEKKPLYRRVNTRTYGVHHCHGGDYGPSKKRYGFWNEERGSRGLDYTPLFKFLLSKVGNEWDVVLSEAISRLDKKEPIYWLVSLEFESAKDYVRLGERSYYSGLYVDERGILKITNPEVTESTLRPFCKCCTHTFNGIRFEQEYVE